MMSVMFFLFSLQVLNKLDLEVLGFCVFSKLTILEWFLTCHFKYPIIPVHTSCIFTGIFIVSVVFIVFSVLVVLVVFFVFLIFIVFIVVVVFIALSL